MAINLP